jgi:hypothetical protein
MGTTAAEKSGIPRARFQRASSSTAGLRASAGRFLWRVAPAPRSGGGARLLRGPAAALDLDRCGLAALAPRCRGCSAPARRAAAPRAPTAALRAALRRSRAARTRRRRLPAKLLLVGVLFGDAAHALAHHAALCSALRAAAAVACGGAAAARGWGARSRFAGACVQGAFCLSRARTWRI